jgi:hypothetical protein
MSNEKIMALFNTPQTSTGTVSGMNIRPTSMQSPLRTSWHTILSQPILFFSTSVSSPAFAYPPTQHSHLLPHQKSLSFGNNLYQQATNFGSQSQMHVLPAINHHPNGKSAPVLQNPSSTFTPEQVGKKQRFS